MDAFFASIEERDDPSLRGKPVVIGADPKGGKGRGVVSTASYAARAFGIHSAMPISAAYIKCPHAIFLPVDMEKYASVSKDIRRILYGFTPDIEPVSIDEAFLDITGSYHLFGTPLETCLLIKSRIKEAARLTASIGLAPTKMAAKIASDLKKPDSMVEVTREGLLDFLRPLDIRKLWGLGEKTEALLKARGIKTIGDLAKRDAGELVSLLGKNGRELWRLANGIDEREVLTEVEAKSISNEVTFEEDTLDRDIIGSALLALCERVSGRLRHENKRARTVTLKIRFKGFQTYTRAVTLDAPTNFSDVIFGEVTRLYASLSADGRMVRLVGVRASNLLDPGGCDSLFEGVPDKRREKTYLAIDRIKKRFGDDSIYRAGGRIP